MKDFDTLYSELRAKCQAGDTNSRTFLEYEAGKHAIGKKIVEEAAEVWMAAEYESKEAAIGEISQLIYHIQVMMLACDIEPQEVYKAL